MTDRDWYGRHGWDLTPSMSLTTSIVVRNKAIDVRCKTSADGIIDAIGAVERSPYKDGVHPRTYRDVRTLMILL